MSLSEATVSVPKKKAVFQTGKKKGKLRPGCRYTTGGRTACSPEAASRLGVTSGSFTVSGRRRKKSASKKRGTMRVGDPGTAGFKLDIGPDGTLRILREKVAAAFTPKEMKVLNPEDYLRQARKQFKSAKRCRDRVDAVNEIQALKNSGLPITTAEIEKLTFAADAFCKSKRKAAQKAQDAAAAASDSAALLGLSGTRRRRKAKKSGGHPCASSNPPSWCNKKRKSRRKSKR
jgi:hypothetical protein